MTSNVRGSSREVPAIAAEQAGVFTLAQAGDEGWTPRQVRRRVEEHTWVRVAGRGYAGAAPEITALGQAWAARLTWPGCVVSHTTAARLHGFPVEVDPDTHVVVGAGAHSATRLRAHQVPLADHDIVITAGGLLACSRHRTALDCLVWLPEDRALRLFAWLSTHGVLTRAELAAAVPGRLGREGTPRLLRLLRVTRSGAVSPAERRMHTLLHAAGLRGWRAGCQIFDGDGLIAVVDLLFAAERLIVEIDGWAAHGSREAFVTDRRRQNRLVNAGYLVLRFTWEDIVRHPESVVASVQRALNRRAAHP